MDSLARWLFFECSCFFGGSAVPSDPGYRRAVRDACHAEMVLSGALDDVGCTPGSEKVQGPGGALACDGAGAAAETQTWGPQGCPAASGASPRLIVASLCPQRKDPLLIQCLSAKKGKPWPQGPFVASFSLLSRTVINFWAAGVGGRLCRDWAKLVRRLQSAFSAKNG